MFILNLDSVYGIDCNANTPLKNQQDIADFENECIKPLGSIISSLSEQIQYLKSQQYLANAQIQQTELKITSTEKEIEVLGSRIDGLDQSLDFISRLLIDKIVQSYKQRETSLFTLLFNSNYTSELLSKIKYVKTLRDNNQKLLIQVQEAKSNFEEQRKLREEKTIELNTLQNKLEEQKIDLKNQENTETRIRNEVQNSKIAYDNKVVQAKKELAGFTSFATAAGGGLKTFGSGSNGWYFTQRDPQWGNAILPGSSSSVMLAGCAVASVAMVCKSYGQNISPLTIVYDSNNFIGGDLWNWAFSCSGKSTEWIGTSQEKVKSYVDNGTPVILRLVAPSVSGLHFVVAWKSDGNDFIIHDPYLGPDRKFTDEYTWSQITTAIAIH